MSSSTSREEFNAINKFEEDSVNISLNNHLLDNEPAFSDDEEEPELKITNLEDDTDDDDIPLSKVYSLYKVKTVIIVLNSN